jgi:hypothetical protein
MSHSKRLPILGAAALFVTLGAIASPASAAKAKPKNPSAAKRPAKAPKASSINAYDVFLAATKLAVDQQKVGFALSKNHNSGDPLDRVYTLEEKTQLIQKNASALAKLRAGFAYTYHNPPVLSFTTMMPYYKEFRAMGRLLALEADVANEKKDTRTAINSSLDAIQLGEMIQRDSPVIGMLVGVACQAIGRRPLHDMIITPDFGADGTKEGAQRLSRIMALHVPYTEILKIEKQANITSAKELYSHPSIAVQAAQTAGGSDDSNGQEEAARQMFAMMLQSDKDQVITSYENQMDSLIERYGQPYDSTLIPISRQSDPLSLSTYKLIYESRFKDVTSEMSSRCMMTMLALRAYFADHKSYPATLQALTPEYFPRVPGDPFAQDAPLHYSVTGDGLNGYSLYSIGPDKNDDGGNPAVNPSAKSENTKMILYPDSLGDFNAFLNHY